MVEALGLRSAKAWWVAFLLKWLGLNGERAAPGLRPRRNVVVALGFTDAFRRCLDEIGRTLGANVIAADESSGIIEAGFGVVQSERVRCTLTPIDDFRTGASVEAIRPAGMQASERSRNVDALADALESSSANGRPR